MNGKRLVNLLCFALACAFMVACASSSADGTEQEEQAGIFRPPVAIPAASQPAPTLAILPSPSPITVRESFRPSATPTCTNNLFFLADLTIPDGSVVAPGALIDKRWQVENNGSCNWDERYRLRQVDGSGLLAESEQMLYPARSGTQALIRINFVAPSEPGIYRSAWQAFDPLNQPFGDQIFIEIQVTVSD